MTTLLIVARVISVQRVSGKAGNGTSRNTYSPIIEIVVESAAIYSVSLLAFVIILTRHHTANSQYFAENIHAQIAVRLSGPFVIRGSQPTPLQGLAPMLIIYHIVAKQARPDTDWATAAVMSAMQFAPAIHQSTKVGRSTGSDDGRETVISTRTRSSMSAT